MAVSGKNVKPRIVENYPGGDIVLNEALSIVMKAEENPELAVLTGKSLIVTDGTTLLGQMIRPAWQRSWPWRNICCLIRKLSMELCGLVLLPMKRWAAAWTTSTWRASGRTMPTRWTAARWASWNMKTSTPSDVVLHVNGCSVHPGSAKGKMRERHPAGAGISGAAAGSRGAGGHGGLRGLLSSRHDPG